MENMGEIIKNLRIKHNLTQEELGYKLGLKKAAINKYETGNVENLKRSVIEKLSKIFNVSPTYLMGLEETKNIYQNDYIMNRSAEPTTEYKTTSQVQKEKCMELFTRLDDTDRIKAIERMETYLEDEKYKKGGFSFEVG